MKRHPARAPRPMLAPVVTGWKAGRYRIVILMWLLSAGWFWAWWLQPGHVLGPVRYWLVTAGMAWIWGMQLYFVLIFLMARRSAAPDPVPGQWRVAMVTTKTPSEPFAVVRKTLEAMLAQDYPHDTWLADEDPSAETRIWCAAHGVQICTRKGIAEYHRKEWPRRTRCKEGNLAYFYDNWGYQDYDIVSQLDADHVPEPGYLREMLRPFADPEVGYVSAPSICGANAAQSWSARTRLYSEAAFHGVFQAGYTGILTPMCIGSHYAVRTVALKQAGGLGPELAEDHSTTMLIAAAGWRGVHAIDAIAMGDGPATLPDLVTQEFQWSRSLMTLLLRYTPTYLGRLPWRLRFLFLLCQSWYALFALTMLEMYVLPIAALSFDMRFADVTYPAFLGHSLPSVGVMILFASLIRRDGLFRPQDAKVLSWEKALFVLLQWPWVLWGCLMAVYDRLSGKFVDFRITPKGDAASASVPGAILWLYLGLAAGAVLPVLIFSHVTEARGFYLLSMINALLYAILVAVILVHQRTEARRRGQQPGASFKSAKYATSLTLIMALCAGATTLRGEAGLTALATGAAPVGLTRLEYVVSGAGSAQGQAMHIRFAPSLSDLLTDLRRKNTE